MAYNPELEKLLASIKPQEDQQIPVAAPVVQQAPVQSTLPAAAKIQAQSPAPVFSNEPIDVAAKAQEALAHQQALPSYVAPQVGQIQEDPEAKKLRLQRYQNLLDARNSLQDDYKKNMQDAEDRKFKSEIWATLGNYLPGVVAGATAMNTKASVKPAEMQKIVAADPTAYVQKKYETDYEKLIKELKDTQDGQLTPKDELQRQITNAYLKAGEGRTNMVAANSKTSAELRALGQMTANESKNELSDKQVESIKGFGTTHSLLSDIEKRLDSGKFDKFIGPYSSKMENAKELNPFSDGMNTEFAQFQSDVTDTLSQYIKSLSGLTVSDKEREALLTSAPKVGDKPQTFKAKLKATKDRLQEYEKKEKEYIARYQGKNTEGYGPKNQSSSSNSNPAVGSIIRSGGKRYEVIDENGNLKEVE